MFDIMKVYLHLNLLLQHVVAETIVKQGLKSKNGKSLKGCQAQKKWSSSQACPRLSKPDSCSTSSI